MTTMKGLERLQSLLEEFSDGDHYLFSIRDFSAPLADLSYEARKMLMSRAVKKGLLQRVCRGLYLNPRTNFPREKVLYHTAAKLRAGEFCYLSLESVLSDSGQISQVPVGWITLMSRGRSARIGCGKWGTIEFVHTKVPPERMPGRVVFDPSLGLWRARPEQALADMRKTGRPLDLVAEGADEEETP